MKISFMVPHSRLANEVDERFTYFLAKGRRRVNVIKDVGLPPRVTCNPQTNTMRVRARCGALQSVAMNMTLLICNPRCTFSTLANIVSRSRAIGRGSFHPSPALLLPA